MVVWTVAPSVRWPGRGAISPVRGGRVAVKQLLTGLTSTQRQRGTRGGAPCRDQHAAAS